MSIREYRNILISELEKGYTTESLDILNAQKEWLRENSDESKEILPKIMGKSIQESITIIDEYLKSNSESSSKSPSLSFKNPDVKSLLFNDDTDTEEKGFSNILLISLTLIIVVTVLILIILV